MPTKTTIFIVRHGLSEANRDKLLSGHINPQLTDEGRVQAKTTKDKLTHIKFDYVYSSDLHRAVETASIIHGTPVPHEHRLIELRERSFGVIDGLPEDQFKHYQEIKMSLSPEEQPHYKYADGMESDYELATRYLKILSKIAKQHTGSTILVGSHGAAMRALLLHIGWANHQQLPTGAIKNAGYIKLTYDNNGFIVGETVGVDLVK